MRRTTEIEQVLAIVHEVVSERFRGDAWIFLGAPLMEAIRVRVDRAEPGKPGA